MEKNFTKKRPEEFLTALRTLGGTSGNKALRTYLGWEEDLYWRVQGSLIEKGEIIPGRGKGGSVRLNEARVELGTPLSEEHVKSCDVTPMAKVTSTLEKPLYQPLKEAIESKWIKRLGFDHVEVAVTAFQGAKNTGGTFTRPDITAAGYKTYVYLPKRLEVVTFEVKSAGTVNIMAVLEAIAHREAAHRSYVIYPIARAKFDTAPEADRITELAQKHGVGIILAEDANNVESWEILLDAIRNEPDPARLDRFIGDVPDDNMKKQLAKLKG